MNLVEIRVAGRYKLGTHVGTGAYSEVYQGNYIFSKIKGKNVHSGEEVAIKLEDQKNRYPQVIYEGQLIQQLQGGYGMPGVYWCGHDGDYNVLVMELLGDNLENLSKLCGSKLTLKTVLMLADQALQILEFIHTKGIVHRDIKPDNFLLGSEKNYHLVHLIDFGLAKRYIDPKSGEHIALKTGKSLLGKPLFTSLNSHEGSEMSRRDDLESLGYVLLYLLKGCQPWSSIESDHPKATKYENIASIYESKKSNCIGSKTPKDVPKEFFKQVEMARELKFDETPPYQRIRRMFKELFVRSYYDFDFIYDWILIPMQKQLTDKVARQDVQLDDTDDTMIKEEEDQLRQMMREYEENPLAIEFDLKAIKEEQKKFQLIVIIFFF